MWGVGREKMKQDGIGRETNHKRLFISGNKLRVAGGGRGKEKVAALWTLKKVCDMTQQSHYWVFTLKIQM